MVWSTFASLNYLAIIVATIAFMALGVLWYSFLFAKPWTRMMGYDMTDAKKIKEMQRSAGPAYLVSLIACFLTSLVSAYLVSWMTDSTWIDIFSYFLVIWVGFQAGATLTGAMFNKKPFALWAIDASYQLVGLMVAVVILHLWR